MEHKSAYRRYQNVTKYILTTRNTFHLRKSEGFCKFVTAPPTSINTCHYSNCSAKLIACAWVIRSWLHIYTSLSSDTIGSSYKLKQSPTGLVPKSLSFLTQSISCHKNVPGDIVCNMAAILVWPQCHITKWWWRARMWLSCARPVWDTRRCHKPGLKPDSSYWDRPYSVHFSAMWFNHLSWTLYEKTSTSCKVNVVALCTRCMLYYKINVKHPQNSRD